MKINANEDTGYTDDNGNTVTQGQIDAALDVGERVFVSLFGGTPVEVVKVNFVEVEQYGTKKPRAPIQRYAL